MNAGFIKRSFASLVDFVIVMLIVYLTFIIGGRTILQNRVADFAVINEAYNELVDAYETDFNVLVADYNAEVELAGDSEALEAEALERYSTAKAVLDAQHSADIQPYDAPLTGYYMTVIYYFAIGFLILTAVYAVATGAKTVGRRLMQIRLSGPVNPASIFFHDIVLKYFFIVLVFSVSMLAGVGLLLLSFVIDFILITFTKKKATLRDIFLKMEVVKTGYGY
ncbi:MAG: RDD family protein [bacterium]